MANKYSLDSKFLDNIDTEEKAYFLGFLYADGYNCEQRNELKLGLQEKDKEILLKLNKIIKNTKPLTKNILTTVVFNGKSYKAQNQYVAYFTNKNLSQRAKQLGCHRNKTFTLKFPNKNQISDILLPHFMRGFMDGDGTFGNYKFKNGQTCIYTNLVSSKFFCTTTKIKLKKILGINTYVCKKGNAYRLSISGRKQNMKFLNWIYNNGKYKIAMERKLKRYKNILKGKLTNETV